jgi:hypothetical protein
MIAPLRETRALLVVNIMDLVSEGYSHLSSAIESTTPVMSMPTKNIPIYERVSDIVLDWVRRLTNPQVVLRG